MGARVPHDLAINGTSGAPGDYRGGWAGGGGGGRRARGLRSQTPEGAEGMKGERAAEEGKGGGDEGSRGVRGSTLRQTLQTHSSDIRRSFYSNKRYIREKNKLELLGRTKQK